MHTASTDMDSLAPGPAVAAPAVAAAAAAPSASSSPAEGGWLVPSASSLSSAAPTSFPSFYSLVSQSGLGIVQSGAFDASTLYRLARESVWCEEQVATGCLLIQGATLVQCWALTHKKEPLQHERQVVQYVLDFYTNPSAPHEHALSSAPSPSSDSPSRPSRRGVVTMVAARGRQITPAVAASALPVASAAVGRQAQWRASFALKLYEVLQAPEFPELQRWMMKTGISTLRLLVQRFWHKTNLGLMSKLLQQVSFHNLGKHLIGAALALEDWDRRTLMRSMTTEEQSAVVAEFGTRIEQCAHNRTTIKQLKKSVISCGEQRALQSMKWRQPSIEDIPSPYGAAGMPSAALLSSGAAAAAAASAPPMPMHFASLLLHAFQQHALADTVQWNQIDLPPHLGSSSPAPARTSTRLIANSGDDAASASLSSSRQASPRSSSSSKRNRRTESSAGETEEAEIIDDADGEEEQVQATVVSPVRQRRVTSAPEAATGAAASPRKRRRGMADVELIEEGEHKEDLGASASEQHGNGAVDEDSADASWHAVHANTDARIYPFNQDLSSYGRFHVAHGSRVGRALYYRRSASDQEQWELHPVDPSCAMTVGAWHRDFLVPYLLKQEKGERIDELIYLIDISVPHLCHQDLRAAIDICRDCDETGPLTLNYFVEQLHGRDIGMPDVQAQLYLSPPTQGAIFTPTHYDGHGSQASIHAVLFGGAANFNLVHTFPTDRHERSPVQEAAFRRILGLAPHGQPQHLPHQQALHFSPGKESWDAQYSRGQHDLPLPSRHELHPGHVMFLPTGLAHNFKKVQADAVASFDPSPMLGYAGDSSYIGGTAASVASNCAAMAAAAEHSRRVSQPPLCFLITGTIALCTWIRRLSVVSGTSSLQREQLAGALPTLASYVQLERQVLLAFRGEEEEESIPVVDVSIAANGIKGDSEWVCARCQGEVANLHGVSIDAAEASARHSYVCVYCLRDRGAHAMPLSFRFYTTMALEELVAACSELASMDEEAISEEAAAPPTATAYQECEAQVALLESILPEGALLAGNRGKQKKSQQARKASFHLDWIHSESKLYLNELKKWIKQAALVRLDADEKARLQKEADKAKAVQPVHMEIDDGKAEAEAEASPSAGAAASTGSNATASAERLLGPGALFAAVKRFKAVEIKQPYRIHADQQASLERAVAAFVLCQSAKGDAQEEEMSSTAPAATSSAATATASAAAPPAAAAAAALFVLDAQVVRSIATTLVVWPHYFEQLYAMLEAATATATRRKKSTKVDSTVFGAVAQQLEVYEFVRAAGLGCSNRVGTDSLDPDRALTVRDSISVDSSIEEQAYSTILGALIDRHPDLRFLHLSPQLTFSWSIEAGGSEEELLRWCRANLELLKSKKYLVFHWGQDHYCCLIMDLQMWREGRLNQRGDGTAAAAAAVSEATDGAAAAARPSRRNKKAPRAIGEEEEFIYSSSTECAPFIHIDTLPSGCHFLLEHSSFLVSICRAFNTLFETQWPVDAASLRSYIHLAGPPAQADVWSCGYHLLYGWSLLFTALAVSGKADLTPNRVTTLCATMKDKSVEQLVQFTLGEFDVATAAVPNFDPSSQSLFHAHPTSDSLALNGSQPASASQE